MTRLTTLLHAGPHYEACWIEGPHGGLCVTRKRKRGGVVTPDSAGEWREAFAAALDATDRDALCRAILNP
jgi:hypothetical protein